MLHRIDWRTIQASASATYGNFSYISNVGAADSDITMSKDISAITLGAGFETFRNHTLDEGLKLDKAVNLRNFNKSLATVLVRADAK